jgi:hypothetical protein
MVEITKRADPLPANTSDNTPKYAAPEVVIVRSMETEEQKDLRIKLRDMAKIGSYADEQNKKNLSELEKDSKEIKFNLNLITQENFSKVKVTIMPYATKNKETCKKLISLMIEKAWVEPKFSVIYAQLCKDLTKAKDFGFNLLRVC